MAITIYLDESGCLGWQLGAPYQRGGSSWHFTLAFRAHPNGLYNYMAKLLLLDVMAEHDAVCFIPDARSLKTELKHALHDYLRTELAVRGAMTKLQTTPWESKDCLALQFTDILAGIVWAHHEFGNSVAYRAASQAIRQKTLFFPR
ncbi:DUF3800 domain-containing protein [Cupriavidus necator]|uniref:DUF3800 domain-containing protein n=1 Tax=Cupriavidus necator TaxID=106590 RepID=UPI0005B49ADC|nr:DUF3800 domain-containing protein [Cupriavidus necator]